MFKIKKNALLLLLFFLILTTGCQKSSTIVDVITFQPADYDVILCTHDQNKSLKYIYMDALLELKAAYPDQFTGGEEEKRSIDELEYKVSTDSPTLLIQKNGQTIRRLSGEKSKN